MDGEHLGAGLFVAFLNIQHFPMRSLSVLSLVAGYGVWCCKICMNNTWLSNCHISCMGLTESQAESSDGANSTL
jgi:hypothetical protein